MNRIIKFTKIRYIMFIVSILLIIGGIAGTVARGGFNLGIDFQAGLNQRVQVAPVAFTVSYNGIGDVALDMSGAGLSLELRNDEGVNTYTYSFDEYSTLADLVKEMSGIKDLVVIPVSSGSGKSSDLTSGLSYPLEIGSEPSYVNIIGENSVSIEDVRKSLAPLGNPLVQVVGKEALSEFIVRVSDPDGTMKEQLEGDITTLLEKTFGANTVVIKQSDYVGPRFSNNLASQSVSLTLVALLLILIYIWFRFKLGFAISAITALGHDVLIMLGFIGATGMEVSTTTIAAVLTIIGYSLNDTIVVFDRIRENQVLLKGDRFDNIINTSITQSLSRTIITSLTTLLAVTALYVFGTGSIQDFALNLIVGIIVGTYSSIFIASPVLLSWTNFGARRKAKKKGVSISPQSVKDAEIGIEDSSVIKEAAIPEA
ncbi:MAG: protein translocase subunit SecF, partial [Spirochaetales bacterium]|nr:protein translocase subunit SecF [Spirochaetales bacterium]